MLLSKDTLKGVVTQVKLWHERQTVTSKVSMNSLCPHYSVEKLNKDSTVAQKYISFHLLKFPHAIHSTGIPTNSSESWALSRQGGSTSVQDTQLINSRNELLPQNLGRASPPTADVVEGEF